MNHRGSTIILCGGPINYTNLPIGTNQSNAMVSVNGKPVIGWILDDLIAKGIRRATVVLREEDHHLRDFLDRAYARRMEIILAPTQASGSIIESLRAGLQSSPTDGLVRVILGDTFIRDSYWDDEDFVYVRQVRDSRRWCLAVPGDDGCIVAYRDKEAQAPEPHLALCGYYHLRRGSHLAVCVQQSIEAGERELSDVLTRYGTTYPIYARAVETWFDFGNIDNLIEARRRLLQPRFFNTLTIDPVLNTITKVSSHDEKLEDELRWYLDLPDELSVLCPRIVAHHKTNAQLHIVQEYYGYPTLAELYLYSDLHPDIWTSIARHLLRIHQEFKRFPGTLEADELRAVYLDKTWKRLDLLRRQDPAWEALLERPVLVYNGTTLYNFLALSEAIHERVEALIQDAPICIIHGDFCFSNILFDVQNQIVRLIDPRGSFGKKGLYGDARYDIAKLRHSISGLYDYILADMFELHQDGDTFTGKIYVNGTPQAVGDVFDHMVADLGYDLDEIRFIEGLLFISMLPLHHGHPQRQRMMYLRGLSLLNDVLLPAQKTPIAADHRM